MKIVSELKPRTNSSNLRMEIVCIDKDNSFEMEAETYGVLEYMPEFFCFWKSGEDFPFFTIKKDSVFCIKIKREEENDNS